MVSGLLAFAITKSSILTQYYSSLANSTYVTWAFISILHERTNACPNANRTMTTMFVETLTFLSARPLSTFALCTPQYSVCTQHFLQTIHDETPVAQHTRYCDMQHYPKSNLRILHPKRTMPAPAIDTFPLKLPQWVTHDVGVNPTMQLSVV
jgi:hypothetical protein